MQAIIFLFDQGEFAMSIVPSKNEQIAAILTAGHLANPEHNQNFSGDDAKLAVDLYMKILRELDNREKKV